MSTVTIHDVVAYVVDKHGPLPVEKIHPILFYINATSLVERGKLIFPDNAIAMPSGPFYPAIDMTIGCTRWRRRFEARYGTRGRRGARRIPPIESMVRT